MNTLENQLTQGLLPQLKCNPLTFPRTVDVAAQRMRILRCTAHAMANSPGGLRFKEGSRPWLDGLVCESGKRHQRSKS